MGGFMWQGFWIHSMGWKIAVSNLCILDKIIGKSSSIGKRNGRYEWESYLKATVGIKVTLNVAKNTSRTLIWLTLVNCSSISISPFFLICFENPNHSSNIRTTINKIVIFAKKRNRNYEINRKYIKKKCKKEWSITIYMNHRVKEI